MFDRSQTSKGTVNFTKFFLGRQPCQSDIMTLLYIETNLLHFVTAKALGQRSLILIALHTELDLHMR